MDLKSTTTKNIKTTTQNVVVFLLFFNRFEKDFNFGTDCKSALSRVEFRLHLKEMDEVADGVGHKLYEKVRSIKAKALIDNRKLTIDEFNKIKKLEEESLKLYNDAWTKIINK